MTKPDPSDSDETRIISALVEAGLYFKEGKGGLYLCIMGDNYVLRNVNADFMLRQPTKEQLERLKKIFPRVSPHLNERELSRTISHNAETNRRASKLRERLNTDGYTNFRSLDGRKMPTVADIDVQKPQNIPTLYMAIDATDPKRPSIVIWGSEFATGNTIGSNRTDEAMMIIEQKGKSLKELQQMLKNAPDNKTFIKQIKPMNITVRYFDDNIALGPKRGADHFKKSLTTTDQFTKRIFEDFQVQSPRQGLHLEVMDYMTDPAGLHVTQGLSDVTSTRTQLDNVKGPPVGKTIVSRSYGVKTVNGQVTLELRSAHSDFLSHLAAKDIKMITKRFDLLAVKFVKVIQKVGKRK